MFKVIIAGSRTFENYHLLLERCDHFLKDHKDIEVVSGCAKGADMLAEQYALHKGFDLKRFPANWSLGRKAGPLRNRQMAEYADALIAFWDGTSKGTKNMILIAKELGLKVRINKI